MFAATVEASIVAKGPRNARIVIVGEAPGADEIRLGVPFVGQSGKELDRMLTDAGINPDECYFTNVVMTRPKDNDITVWLQDSPKRKTRGKNITPDHWELYRGWLCEPHVAEDARRLIEDIKEIQPNVVIALGNTPFWALCKEGATGKISTWRGSTLWSDVLDCKVIPAYHPAFILRQWQHRRITVQDFRRVKHASQTKELPNVGWDFTLAPTYDQAAAWLAGVMERLEAGPVRMTCDIEGAQKKTICLAIATSEKRAICVPLLYKFGFYWKNEDQRFVIYNLLRRVLTHKNAQVVNQNIGFDTQFLVNDLLIYPNIYADTLVAQNILFPGSSNKKKKEKTMNLAYMASMYCKQYRYWKDDSDEFWKAKRISNWEQIWFYNCEDAARTFEVHEAQERAIDARKLRKQFDFLQRDVFPLMLKAMFRGIRIDQEARVRMLRELEHVMAYAQERVNKLTSRRLDISSPQQLKDFFYREMRLPVQFSQPKKGEKPAPTCDADALVILANIEPLVREVVRWINLYRSYIAAKKICKAGIDKDGRMRCSYSLGLVETYRFSSSENPYGGGTNFQNISNGKATKEMKDD